MDTPYRWLCACTTSTRCLALGSRDHGHNDLQMLSERLTIRKGKDHIQSTQASLREQDLSKARPCHTGVVRLVTATAHVV